MSDDHRNQAATPAQAADEPPPDPSRRQFIRGAVAAGVALTFNVVGFGDLARWNGMLGAQVAEAVIFPDPSLCIGCLTCEVVCSQVHKQAGLSEVPRIRIYNDPNVKVDPEIQRNYPDRGTFTQEPCLQCPTAECLYVCPVNAFHVEPKTGARYIKEDVCVSCGRCAEACPFPVSNESLATGGEKLGQKTRITYDPAKDTYTKCDLCYFRPEGPACVERCPVNVRIRQGIVKSDRLCLDKPRSDEQTWTRLKAFQTFEGSPAPRQSA
ncbi:MAG: 4Fe-4S dicluster domain-containing protein [Planctomycetes bacterium]|nr:4Fe-4S dicluster domain-containing protein [Planctomycetota bacterium]